MATTRSVRCSAFLSLVLAITAASCQPSIGIGRRPEQVEADSGFALLPPQVDSAWVRLLDAPRPGGNALMHVRFAPGQRIGQRIAIRPGERTVQLRDDGLQEDSAAGDRTYSALIDFPIEQFVAAQRRLASHAAAGGTVPVFRGRQLAGQDRPRFVAAERIRPGSEFVLQAPQGIPTTVDPNRSLVIRNGQVINDPQRTWNPCTRTGNTMGAWSFPYLMTQIANQSATGVSPGQLVERWLLGWSGISFVNGETVPGRTPPADVLAQMDSAGELALSQAPFRLVAIVSRVDLRGNGVYGGGTGEGRFVFQAVDPQQNCAPLRFTIILEYALPGEGCPAAQTRAAEWMDLSTHPFGPAHSSALETLTAAFTQAGARPPRLPNRSALNQLRTNELSTGLLGMVGFPHWDLREFKLERFGTDAGHLLPATVAQTPSYGVPQAVLSAYMQSQATSILNDKHGVPRLWQGAPMLGGRAPAPNPSFFWQAEPSPVIPDLRHKFSLATCNGCHTRETATQFLHVSSGFSTPSPVTPPLSGFMTGIQVTDPQSGVVRNFSDLLRRQQDLSSLVNSVCPQHILFDPMRMPH